jgi:hypothetical protein
VNKEKMSIGRRKTRKEYEKTKEEVEKKENKITLKVINWRGSKI